jgi:DNA polymerase-3 subunit beta
MSNKTTLPILENFLFTLEDSTLTLTSSDIATTLVTSVQVENPTGSKGSVAVPSHLLLNALKEFPEQPLDVDINDSNLAMKISSANGTYDFIGQNGDEFPSLPTLAEDAQKIVISTSQLYSGINKTLFCAGDDELRPVMNGVFFDIKEKLTIVATDAHKLVRFITPYSSTDIAEEGTSFILPKKPATTLKTILTKDGGDVEIVFDKKNARFQLENHTMVCRLVEGKFPNYNGVIPKENPYKVITDREVLHSALKRVAVFANQASSLIKLDFSNNQIHISAQDIDFSISAEETISCQFEGDPIKIGFKSDFLIEMLNNLSSKEIILEMSEPSRAGLIIPFENEADEDILMLLMPMLLND